MFRRSGERPGSMSDCDYFCKDWNPFVNASEAVQGSLNEDLR